MKRENSFSVSGFIATEPKANKFQNSTRYSFPLSISNKDTDKDGNPIYKSALMNAEVWVKNDDTTTPELLKKGSLVNITGWLKADTWTDKTTNEPRSRVILAAKSVEAVTNEDPA